MYVLFVVGGGEEADNTAVRPHEALRDRWQPRHHALSLPRRLRRQRLLFYRGMFSGLHALSYAYIRR